MNNLTPQQEAFQQFKQTVRSESLGLLEQELSAGHITREEFDCRKNDELWRYVFHVGNYIQYNNISLPLTLPHSPAELNQEEILLMAYTTPVLRSWIEQWRNKAITWEQATYGIIWALLRDVNFWRDRYVELIEKHPLGLWLKPNDYTVIIKKDEVKKMMESDQNV